MILDGIFCDCGEHILDNPSRKSCSTCGSPYSSEVLKLIKSHHDAKMRLVNQKLEPVAAVELLGLNRKTPNLATKQKMLDALGKTY